MKSFDITFTGNYPPWASKSQIFKRIFFPWLRKSSIPRRKDQPSDKLDVTVRRRHGHPLSLCKHSKAPRKFLLSAKRQSSRDYMARLERRLNQEIHEALNCRQTEEAIHHLHRYLARPFQSEKNRQGRLAYIYEYVGETEKAIKIHAQSLDKYLQENDIHNAASSARELTRISPSEPFYRGQLAKLLLETDSPRSAVNEMQIQKRLCFERGDIKIAEPILERVVTIARDLKKRGLLAKQVLPSGEFSFDLDNQIDINLDGTGISP